MAGSLCLVYRRRDSYLLNINKTGAHLYGGTPDSFQTDNSHTVGIESGISRTEVRVLATELRQLRCFASSYNNLTVFYYNGYK